MVLSSSLLFINFWNLAWFFDASLVSLCLMTSVLPSLAACKWIQHTIITNFNCDNLKQKYLRTNSASKKSADEQTVHQITKIKLFSTLLITFSNICRYFLTVLSKQQLIQPLEYWTSLELLRSKSKSFFYAVGASRPDVWGIS